ncbi:sensor histidine kinase [Dactylosporangium sp. CA-092794]|uniref:sensor histidine kinase n=1 Tax=Dactylosporangium sp. CA-092794 TaxID=3239929 RepID=UPI003D912BBD
MRRPGFAWWDRLRAADPLTAGRPPVLVGLAVAVAMIAAEKVALDAVGGAAEGGEVYLLGVLVMASLWGAAAGVITAVLSTVVFNYFQLGPAGLNLTLRDAKQLAVFMVAALLVSAIANVARSRAAEAARAARERQAVIGSLRESRRESGRLLAQQAALRRVATQVAWGALPAEVFAAVTTELHRIFSGFSTALVRYEPDGTVTSVAGRDEAGNLRPPFNAAVDGENVTGAVLASGRAARAEYEHAPGPIAAGLRKLGIRSAVGVPILVEGRLWGVAVVGSSHTDPIPDDAEERLRGFADLLAAAIANADSRAALARSRARLVTTADEARRKIERDLHDGAQQRIVSLALELRMAEAAVPDCLPEVRGMISHAVDDLTDVHENLRELGRGIHPALLSAGGLGPALRTLARRSPLPVEIELAIERRLPDSVEVAVYFVVSEALTNAAKHAHASVVCVTAKTTASAVLLRVCDDGVGGADPDRGTGLVGLRDRVEALGGRFSCQSPKGQGTSLSAEIPLADLAATPIASWPLPPLEEAEPTAG